MSKAPLKRKSFFIDERDLRAARRVLGVESDAEAVRISLREIARMRELWRFMERTRDSLAPGSFADS
jgi:hypothetical protein